ncbi:unnamed protein product [Cyprideis torosa]|uniref:Uncharacterized protein n=1 Tax=Cyprideis torosa TaxID=163714 RepID=A0A7R8W1H0_9CRUS|nr:unnamed protein product [Cyprideis torosa]CAG0879808.1 unnamed protein product [Cyprideis torosa]
MQLTVIYPSKISKRESDFPALPVKFPAFCDSQGEKEEESAELRLNPTIALSSEKSRKRISPSFASSIATAACHRGFKWISFFLIQLFMLRRGVPISVVKEEERLFKSVSVLVLEKEEDRLLLSAFVLVLEKEEERLLLSAFVLVLEKEEERLFKSVSVLVLEKAEDQKGGEDAENSGIVNGATTPQGWVKTPLSMGPPGLGKNATVNEATTLQGWYGSVEHGKKSLQTKQSSWVYRNGQWHLEYEDGDVINLMVSKYEVIKDG